MLGNDLVDLKAAARESNWRRKGFLEKVFSEAEQEKIKAAPDKDITVWLLWSMKEAAYKAHQRKFDLPRRLNWLRQECTSVEMGLKKASGTVEIENSKYFTSSRLQKEFIFTTAALHQKEGAKNVIFNTSSDTVKKELLQHIATEHSVEPETLQLSKNQTGIPFVSRAGAPFFDGFSLTDHGRFYAFSMAVNDL